MELTRMRYRWRWAAMAASDDELKAGAVPDAERAEDVWRISPGNASGYVWDDTVSGGRAGVGADWTGQLRGLEGPFLAGDEYVHG